jgi:serine/threonine-protein kinase
MHILREVALGLEHVHEQKIIHRNINPTNIILTSTGGINITDFNIACEIMQAAPLVIDQEIIGTPAYMAPEQITKQMPLDPRTDIYTFGILAYEFVTGKQPFMGCTLFELLQAHLYQPIPLIDSADRKLPPWYNFFIGVCTEKKPPKRFQTMREIIDFLEQRMERLKFIEQSTNPAPWWITPLWYLTFGKEKPREYYT